MNQHGPSRPGATAVASVRHRRGGARLRVIAGLVVGFALLAVGGVMTARSAERLTPPEPLGAPLRLATAEGDAVLLLTAQVRTRCRRSRLL